MQLQGSWRETEKDTFYLQRMKTNSFDKWVAKKYRTRSGQEDMEILKLEEWRWNGGVEFVDGGINRE